ncbi:MAG: MMPL family transporter [Paludibacteraceae bacterium]
MLRIYDYFSGHRCLLWSMLGVVVVVLAGLCTRLRFSEDISDFLPLDSKHKEQMAIYQEVAQAERIMVLFDGSAVDSTRREEALMDAVDAFAEEYARQGMPYPIVAQVNMQAYWDAIAFVYAHAPYFLTEVDYRYMDSLLAEPQYLDTQMQINRRLLQMPVSSFVSTRIQYDPFNLFGTVLHDLQQFSPKGSAFEMVDGYMMTKDGRMAFAYMDSPYGGTETRQNARLLDSLEQVVQATRGEVSVRLLGSPVISVGNARQIKHDTILTTLVALIAIAAVLFVAVRIRSRRSGKDGKKWRKAGVRGLLPIFCAAGFGWLFGVAMLALVHPHVSLIVVGIGTILLGVAINYPLHLVVHRQYTADMRTTLQEELSPLIVGNITTIAAFMTLLPLQATALRDLGLFAAAMLVGTIGFTVVVLPHLEDKGYRMKDKGLNSTESEATETKESSPFSSVFVPCSLLIITLVLGIFAGKLSFDDNLSNINYMTPQERADFAYLTQQAGQSSDAVYHVCPDSLWRAIPTTTGALRFLPNPDEQARRLARWQEFCRLHPQLAASEISRYAEQYGFRSAAFDNSPLMHNEEYFVQTSLDFFSPLTATILQGHYRNGYFVEQAERDAAESTPTHWQTIDIQALNRQVTASLSDNFNYIGSACSLIVFLFLWGSFFGHFRGQRRYKQAGKALCLAVIAFVPMMVSWVWILGIMHLCGLQFNIVNIILATFIFGQGDDYTIFMVEGLLYEHRTGKRILPQFRTEIALSALIMLVGIGVLVLAKHPAMFSLGAVTLIGMGSVVVMAFALPPMLFQVSVRLKKHIRSMK